MQDKGKLILPLDVLVICPYRDGGNGGQLSNKPGELGGCWGGEMRRAVSLGRAPQDASEVRNVVPSRLYSLWM